MIAFKIFKCCKGLKYAAVVARIISESCSWSGTISFQEPRMNATIRMTNRFSCRLQHEAMADAERCNGRLLKEMAKSEVIF